MIPPIFIKHKRALVAVRPEEIIGLRTDRNYTRIFLPDEKYYLVRATLTATLAKMPPGMFVQTSRTYAMSVNYIETINRDTMIVAGQEIPIGKEFYDKVLEKLVVIL
ncbi:MAG: LytTR family transcriptional regulator [Chitinophagaceae bacterium]|nr:LytTR family transcriptional regulator [Chitinophagaceae bacterium]